ncbi:MAG: hypothetical protein LBE59_12565 [Nevskiaceae bacterium]|nr:hypothetical protein [Nevskiaceae bacterium]
MSDTLLLDERIEIIERGYEFLLAYAAQGRQEERGTELRQRLSQMHDALSSMEGALRAGFAGADPRLGIEDFLATVERDVAAARGAIGVVLGRARIPSLLVDNLNANVHLRALLTDVFLIEQALKSPVAAA